MTTDPRADIVVEQYQRWVYPEPIEDLPTWLTDNWQWFDPSHAHRIFWPDRSYRAGLDILIAGCGTNQAAVFAHTNPDARVTAIDVSEPSLRHTEKLKKRYNLRNLELHLLPIEEVGSLDRDFDLIVSTGVLHHLANPQVGMNALAQCLRTDGVIALMLYARYGRLGVEMMESAFAELGLKQDERSIALVHQALAYLPADHPVRSYLDLAPDLAFDAGLVDTFLHGRERSYTVTDCLDLVASSGLVFQDWLFKSLYEPPVNFDNAFLKRVAELPEEQRWSVMERVHTRNGCHFFTACRADRPKEQYRFDVRSATFGELIPTFRYRCGIDGSLLIKPGWSTQLEGVTLEIARRVDGRRSVNELAAGLDFTAAHEIIRWLWEQDYIALTIDNPAHSVGN